ncbi:MULTISPECIES: ribonuclease HII [Niallia]|jgi:ribonuclease HII|uniref:Ribonuclease HII n=2 Tax=Niallia TaxID=2837506 RepID=A0A941G8W7_NIACI|nr:MULTISPECIES: ribonuclease HII [Niallia]MCB5235345.1 ribonuclease HII [Niallia circulans]MDU1844979.1 ribonuclease HII [Niallia nealsonii]MED3794717.1 ribonuclease HII [Niallia alba]NMO77328.1 ribonuclease HII [Niallia alba]
MKLATMKEIKEALEAINEKNDPFILELQKDERKGAQKLLEAWLKRIDKEQRLHDHFVTMNHYEKEIRNQGYTYIAGIDEVGRGPLAGPVVTAAVILPEDFYLPGIDDSKKLSEKKRELFYEVIQQEAIAIGVGIIQPAEIDRINIYQATKKGMLEAVQELSQTPDYLLIDAMKLATPYPSQSLIKGDSKSVSIAAASIIAKVTRDRMMKELHQEYPDYHFASNMGYGTQEHLVALKECGITIHHRKSFSPIKEMVENR